MRVINVADSLKKLGVVKGALKDDKLLYFDESGQTKLQFTEVDSVRGISRLVRYVRKTQSVEFTPVTVLSGSRAPYLLASRALAASTTSKPPPYSHFIRLPVPLVPGAFFSIRYASLYEMEYIERELLLIFVSQSEDPTKWPVQNPTPCFFNKWRATRAAIAAIMRHDPQFSYTLTRLSPPASEGAVNESKGGRNGAPVQQGDILLSIYSGGKVMQETTLPEQSLLLGVRDCLARYAAQWAVEVPPIEEVTLMIMEIRRGTVSTYRNILSSLLQYSELFRQTDDTMSLNLQITADLTICLAKVGKLTKSPSLKEVLGEAVFREQFSMLLPIIDVHRRAHAFLMRYAKSESFSFRCFESSSSKNQEGDCSRKYRWELQQHSSKGSEAATVVQTEEGTTRHGALAGLLERIDQRPDTAKGHCNAFVASCESKLTVELYQAALARERGFERITHEYDVEQKALLVKGVPKQLASASNANNSVVIRAIPLTAAHPIGTFIHRYYRLELKLPDPPQLLNDEKLRLLCLSTIYGACAPHFSMPLPPLETALVCVREKQSWYSSLRLPSQLFALKGPRFVEFGCRSRGKHEGRREAVCLLYKSLHGHPSPLLQHYFSSLPAPSPSPDPGCGTDAST
ncbi:hypothetical protein ERJ75_000867000 [Trypanosoma vivax]|nr:hypothetical protein ERJ75_000867000 [Trypanosoma vivax]